MGGPRDRRGQPRLVARVVRGDRVFGRSVRAGRIGRGFCGVAGVLGGVEGGEVAVEVVVVGHGFL